MAPGAFDQASLHQAVQQALTATTVPAHVGSVVMLDPSGVHAVTAYRTKDGGWTFEGKGDYDWARGFGGSLSVSKTW